MEEREKQILIVKNLLYFGVVLAFFVLGEIPLLDPLWTKAIFVIPAVVSISMCEGDLTGGIFGFIGGLMIDTYAAHIFGLASALFAVLAFACGTLVIYLLQDNLRTAFILTGAASSIYGIISYYVLYGMWPGEGNFLMFFNRTLPMIFVTTLGAYPSYHLIKYIKGKFEGGGK